MSKPKQGSIEAGITPRRFGFRDFKSEKFWELEVVGSRLVVRSGALGAAAPSETKEIRCPTPEAAAEQAAELVTKATGVEVTADGSDFLEEEFTLYQYDFGAAVLEVGCKGSKAMLRYSESEGRRMDPRETLWARFESPRAATSAETRIRKAFDKATTEERIPELSVIAKLLVPPAKGGPECPCKECARLADEGGHAPSLSSSSTELTFTEHSTPVIVAGKLFVVGVTSEVLRELGERIDAFAKERDEKVVLVAQSPPTWPPDGVIGRALMLGRLVAVGNHHGLTKLAVADLRTALTDSEALPWTEMLPLLSDPRLTSALELEWDCTAEPDDTVQLRVFATGAMASGMVGFGVPTRDPDSDEEAADEEESDPRETTPGLEEIWGQDMDQKRQPKIVYGNYVGCCDFHDNEGPVILDVSAGAHKVRTKKLGGLAKKAGYYLVGRYD